MFCVKIGSAEDANRVYFGGPGDANSAPFASLADPLADLAKQTVPLLRPRRTWPWKTKLRFADAIASEDPGPSTSGAYIEIQLYQWLSSMTSSLSEGFKG